MKRLALAGALLLIPAHAWADGYCEHVEHAAASEASLLYSPEVFGSFGFGEQPPSDVAGTNDGVRLTAGLRYSLGDIVEGNTTKKKAHAECKRHLALDKVEGASSYRALAAKAK